MIVNDTRPKKFLAAHRRVWDTTRNSERNKQQKH